MSRTGSNLGASCSQLVDGLLDVVDAGGEVCAALEKLHLLAEVVHGESGSVVRRSLQGRGRIGAMWRVLVLAESL